MLVFQVSRQIGRLTELMSNNTSVGFKTIFHGLVQAVATSVVCFIAVGAVLQLQKWEAPNDGYLDDVALLLVFGVAALVSAALVLVYPAYLVFSQRLKEGFSLLISTILWLIVILVGILGVIILIR
jgi:ABC-type multidrug transport system fused ATPase/permease subunit